MNPTAEATLSKSLQAYSEHSQKYADDNAQKMEAEVYAFARKLPPACFILDAGCGPGRDMARFTKRGFAPVGVDIVPEFVAMASAHGAAVLGDLRALPYEEPLFDGVWACASLVHFDPTDALKALEEFARVTKPGGRLLVSVKRQGETGWAMTAHGRRWFYIWKDDEFLSVLKQAGWEAEEVQTEGLFVEVEATLKR